MLVPSFFPSRRSWNCADHAMRHRVKSRSDSREADLVRRTEMPLRNHTILYLDSTELRKWNFSGLFESRSSFDQRTDEQSRTALRELGALSHRLRVTSRLAIPASMRPIMLGSGAGLDLTSAKVRVPLSTTLVVKRGSPTPTVLLAVSVSPVVTSVIERR